MTAPVDGISQLAEYLASVSQPLPLGFDERVRRAVLQREAERVLARIDALASGELNWLDLSEAWQVLELARSTTTTRELRCSIHGNRLREIDQRGASTTFDVLRGWASSSPLGLRASLLLRFDSELDLTREAEALGLALDAARQGWKVNVEADDEGGDLLAVEIRSASGETVSLHTGEASQAPNSVVRFDSRARTSQPGSGSIASTARARALAVPQGEPVSLGPAPVSEEGPRSVADLFADRIVLRDLEPRAAQLEGIATFRRRLGWDRIYVPRKNEPQYAQALIEILNSAGGKPPRQIVYVGDTLLNDGTAIRGLQEVGPPGSVWGFLCGATRSAPPTDFSLDRIHFGREWRSLRAFVSEAEADGLRFEPGTWFLFDLDQTVYAAKASADEALMRARWDAVAAYLASIVPSYRFDPARVEQLYREFDRDAFHLVTRDNMDYVVLLVLAVASGLADAAELREFAATTRPSIGALAEELQRRASVRVGHEEIDAVLDEIKAVHYNTLADDQTPCKEFRRCECLAMAARMRGERGDGDDERIRLNREVVTLIDRVRGSGAQLLAVSDRPIEAAVADSDGTGGEPTDLMTIPMETGR